MAVTYEISARVTKLYDELTGELAEWVDEKCIAGISKFCIFHISLYISVTEISNNSDIENTIEKHSYCPNKIDIFGTT